MTAERLVMESLLRIPDKEGNDVDFVLNQDQALLDANLTGRDIVVKYRQGGFSMYGLGRNLIRCLGERNRRVVLVAHNSDTTQKLLSRVHYMIKHFKGPQPKPRHSTINRLVFDQTDSSITIGTAGNDDIGVGDTITDLHCSEVSRWPNPDALLSGLFQAVPPTGNILIESTGRGAGNWFHKAAVRAMEGQGRYRGHFFHWLNTQEYSVDLTEEEERELLANLDPSLEEPQYLARGLTPGQLAFRRQKLEEMNYDLRSFKENYPLSVSESFQGTGFNIFQQVNYVPDPLWHRTDPWTWVLGSHPKVGRPYIFGVDPAGGVGQNNSAIEGFDAETGEQVLEYSNSMIQPDMFGLKVYDLGMKWNEAHLVPERNNHGAAVILRLLDKKYPAGKLHRGKISPPVPGRLKPDLQRISDFGIYTSEVTKTLIITELQTQVQCGHNRTPTMTIHSDALNTEMSTFVEGASGKMEASDGCFDDRVMSAALAAYGRWTALRRWQASGEAEKQAGRPKRHLGGGMSVGADQILLELATRYEAKDGSPISAGVI